jgi:hypothetical protein
MEALAQSNDLLQQQQQQQAPQATDDELAAFSAGMAAVLAAQTQQMPFADELQQLQQQQVANQHHQQVMAANHAAMADWEANAGLLQQLQQAAGGQNSWPVAFGGGGGGRRAGALSPTAMAATSQAAAQLRARLALTGEPWLGDMLGIRPRYAGHSAAVAAAAARQQLGLMHGVSPFAEASACPAPQGSDYAGYIDSQSMHLLPSMGRDEAWPEVPGLPAGLVHTMQAEEQGTRLKPGPPVSLHCSAAAPSLNLPTLKGIPCMTSALHSKLTVAFA